MVVAITTSYTFPCLPSLNTALSPLRFPAGIPSPAAYSLRQPGIPRSARSWRLPVAESLSFRFAVIPRMATQLCSILPGFQLVRQNSDDSLVPPHRQTDKAEVTLTSFSLSWLTAHQSMTVCIPQLHRDALDLADCRPASRAPCAHALARSQ